MHLETDQSPNESPAVENLPILQRIGAGSFATVYISQGGACAFKVVHNSENATVIKDEYRMLTNMYFNFNTDSFFKLPRPYAFYNPATGPGGLEVRGCQFTAEAFRLTGITKASYAMDRIFALPLDLSQPIRQLFYPPSLKKVNPPTLCRLYFGRALGVPTSQGARPSQFCNSANFPLDIARYSTLQATIYNLPEIDKVITGMGDMLARIHWLGNCDGRDIEWVLGGDGYSGISYFVIDFNQVREWGKTMEGVDTLVSAFMSNDPYYPRPRPQNPQYQIFRTAYLAAFPAEQHIHDIALAFLAGIEEEQERRDAALGTP